MKKAIEAEALLIFENELSLSMRIWKYEVTLRSSVGKIFTRSHKRAAPTKKRIPKTEILTEIRPATCVKDDIGKRPSKAFSRDHQCKHDTCPTRIY
jgi:hypothetical protein